MIRGVNQLQALRGTQDILPNDIYKWLYMENIIRDLCALYGYGEIRTPIFEETKLFLRGIGDTTDVVTKEMYTCLLYTSPSPRDLSTSRMPSSA